MCTYSMRCQTANMPLHRTLEVQVRVEATVRAMAQSAAVHVVVRVAVAQAAAVQVAVRAAAVEAAVVQTVAVVC